MLANGTCVEEGVHGVYSFGCCECLPAGGGLTRAGFFGEGQVQEGSLLFSFEYSIVAQVRGGKRCVAQGLAIQKS